MDILDEIKIAINHDAPGNGFINAALRDAVVEIEKLREEVTSTLPYLRDIISHEILDLKISAVGAEITLNTIISRHKDI